MKLTRTEFDNALNGQELHLALIGMSNIGKSITARRIAASGLFKNIEIDSLIGEELGLPDMQALADWMGFPWQDGYAERAQRYLEAESALSLGDFGTGNQVLDTTGSVIHIANEKKNALSDRYLCIYLEAQQSDIDRLAELYFAHPKPTIWGQYYQLNTGEEPRHALLRCYPHLLEARAKLYADLADVTIPANDLYALQTGDEILDCIRAHIKG